MWYAKNSIQSLLFFYLEVFLFYMQYVYLNSLSICMFYDGPSAKCHLFFCRCLSLFGFFLDQSDFISVSSVMSEGAGRLMAEIIYTLNVAWSILDILTCVLTFIFINTFLYVCLLGPILNESVKVKVTVEMYKVLCLDNKS